MTPNFGNCQEISVSACEKFKTFRSKLSANTTGMLKLVETWSDNHIPNFTFCCELCKHWKNILGRLICSLSFKNLKEKSIFLWRIPHNIPFSLSVIEEFLSFSETSWRAVFKFQTFDITETMMTRFDKYK